jgi:hypothetical protein
MSADVTVVTRRVGKAGPGQESSARAETRLFRDGGKTDAAVLRHATIDGKERPTYAYRNFWDGSRFFHRQESLQRDAKDSRFIDASVSSRADAIGHFESSVEIGAYPDGVLPSDQKPFYDVLLSTSTAISVTETLDANKTPSLILTADFPTGEYTIQLDAAAPYLLREARLRRGREHLIGGVPSSSPSRVVEEVVWNVAILRTETINGISVATVAETRSKLVMKGGAIDAATARATRKNVRWNPDIASSGFLRIDLPENTHLTNEDFPGALFVWREGQIRPFVDQRIVARLLDASKDLAGQPQFDALLTQAEKQPSAQQPTAPNTGRVPSSPGENNGDTRRSTRWPLPAGAVLAIAAAIALAGGYWARRRRGSTTEGRGKNG